VAAKDTRNLTDADVEAIADALEARITSSLYRNIGQGVWALFQKAVIGAIVAIAAYGYFKGTK
jgi:hypothetical protein